MPKHQLKRDYNNRLEKLTISQPYTKTKVNQGILIEDSLSQRKAKQLFTNTTEW